MADPVLSLQMDTPSKAASLGYLILDDATYGLLGTGLLAPDVIYDEKIAHARSISIQRGMSQFTAPLFQAATGTLSAVLDNRTRLFDPATSSDITPGRAVQCSATYNAVTYDLFTGVIHDWQLNYPTKWVQGDATTTVAANDGFAQLAQLNVTESRPSELTGTRIAALAELIGWPAALQAIDAGLTLMPTGQQTVSALSAMQEAADSEMGELYVETDGTLTFRDRDHVVADTRSMVSQATFGDSGAELLFADVTLSFSDTQILNSVTLIYDTAGDSVTATDATSIAQYGLWPIQLQVRISDPPTAGRYASYLVSLFAQPAVYLDSVVINPFRDPTNLFPQVLGRKLGDRITVKFQPPGGGSRIVHDAFIRGIKHDFTAPMDARDWTTTFVTQDASKWPSVFVLDTSNLDSTDVLWF